MSAMSRLSYIVICQQAWMNESGYGIDYNWDGRRFGTREAAITHGWRVRGSDDFNIGVMEGRYLVSFDWMEEAVGDAIELAEVADAMGLRSRARLVSSTEER